ncbi:L,D-transpeptidase [Ahrensia sp. R2A130]|uniref:L,D-transpeptidase n=1 Tax=Ahrensia sp. R2A130 TaxID=744979 RepID=UPI0001E0B4C4|nr:L,D-transpeptidase [Ahrensia sp. R2A130]EFL88702.1 ErfK/YbiS/YcfS/YnhG [Ahrensia sp. R2A130]
MRLLKIATAAIFATAAFAVATPASARSVVAADVPRGTILVDTSQRRLYLGLGRGQALSYTVAVGRAGKQWTGTTRIRSKRWKPAWSPTAEIIRENPGIQRVIPSMAANNPMGVAALVLGKKQYAIHGTNRPSKIGKAVSYGCIRMRNADIADLYKRVGWGTRVIVQR